MRNSLAQRRGGILLLIFAAIAFGQSCATVVPLMQDERPPVVVSSGSVDFDPTTGTFERNGSDKKWKNKGKNTDGEPVRFEVVVTNATCSPNATFSATKLMLYASAGATTESVVIDIQGGNLNIKSVRENMKQATKGGPVKLDSPTMKSLVVTEGADLGTVCALTNDSTVTINQKNQ